MSDLARRTALNPPPTRHRQGNLAGFGSSSTRLGPERALNELFENLTENFTLESGDNNPYQDRVFVGSFDIGALPVMKPEAEGLISNDSVETDNSTGQIRVTLSATERTKLSQFLSDNQAEQRQF